ncbi:MAG: FAD:protein FMN transferase [Phycisphaeraceae bacterium]
MMLIARRTIPAVLAGVAVLLNAGCASAAKAPPDPKRYEYTHQQMGTYFRIVLYSHDEAKAKEAAKAAFDRIDELNAIFSDYDPHSEVSKLSASSGGDRAVKLSDDLWKMLREADRFARMTDGAFDVTVGPVVDVWRWARRNRQMPPQDRLDAAIKAVGYDKITFDEEKQTATLKAEKMKIDLGGIAVGWTLDDVMKSLKEKGFTQVLLDGGGDILVGDAPPGKEGWRIGVAPLNAKDGPPSRYIILTHGAITTSGDMWRFIEIDGKRYSHIVDPKTGLGLTDHSSVTLISKDALTADALATAVSVLGPTKGLELVEKTEGVAAIILREPGKEVETYESKRVKDLKIEVPGEKK